MRKILVIGGTGMVGSHVLHELAGRDARVSVMTRSPDKARDLPTGIVGVVADLLAPHEIESAFAGVDAVFLVNALGPSELHEGLAALNNAQAAGVRRLVYLSIHRVAEAPHIPHFAAKLPFEAALARSGIPYTILRANNFYQNDYWYRDALVQAGVYPQPLGNIGLSRVDVRDIAEVAAIALTSDVLLNETVNLVGPDPWTGPATTMQWSEALGKAVLYAGDDLDAWEQASLEFLPASLVYDLKLMYAFFLEHGLVGNDDEVATLTELLGRPPRSFTAFAHETARTWLA